MATSPVGPRLSSRRCSVCGRALTIHEAIRGGHCATAPCQHGAVKLEYERQRQAAAASLAPRVDEARRAVIATLGIDNESLATAVVPASKGFSVKLPRKRKAAFREHLAGIVAESFRLDAQATARSPPDDGASGAPQPDNESRAVQAACATCRGHCCHHGAHNHAFLNTETLHRYRTFSTSMRARAIVAAYMHRIPDVSVEDSCVFHAASGCTLPRRMRSSTCNTYHCEGVRNMQSALAESEVRKVLIIAAADGSIARSIVHDCAADGETPGRYELSC